MGYEVVWLPTGVRIYECNLKFGNVVFESIIIVEQDVSDIVM